MEKRNTESWDSEIGEAGLMVMVILIGKGKLSMTIGHCKGSDMPWSWNRLLKMFQF